jgi:ribonucleoside-diphosphate reductase alpha chain
LENNDEVLKKKVDLFELWKKLIGSIFEQGMPFIFFRDTVNKLNPNKHKGMIYSSNLCMEIAEVMSFTIHLSEKIENNKVIREKIPGYFPVCNLASVNLAKVNKKEDFEEVMPILVRMLDNVITFQFYPIPDAKIYNENFRSIGIGVSNYHYLLAKNKIHWESEEHLKFADKLFELMAFYTLKASNELAKEKGKYKFFDGSEWSKGIIFGKTKEELMEETKKNNNNLPWDELIEEIKKYGLRNANFLALMPTGSTSLIIGTTASIDPVFDLYYKEENLSGILPRVVPEADKLAFYYKNAYLIDQTWSIKAASIRQKWIDQSQSFNLYIDPRFIDGPTLTKYYLLAWEKGLKTIYYLRSKSISDFEECESCQV